MSTQVVKNSDISALNPVLSEIFDELVRYMHVHRPDIFQETRADSQNVFGHEFSAHVPMEILRNELRNILSQINSFAAQKNESENAKSGLTSASKGSAEVPFEGTISNETQAVEERIKELENIIALNSKSVQDLTVSCCTLQEENERLQRQHRFLKRRNKALEDVQESHEQERELFRATISGLRKKIRHVHKRLAHQVQKAKNVEQICEEYNNRLHETGATSEIWSSRIKELRNLHDQIFKNLVGHLEAEEAKQDTSKSAQQNGGVLDHLSRSKSGRLQPPYEYSPHQTPYKEGSLPKELDREEKELADKQGNRDLPNESVVQTDEERCALLASASTPEAGQGERNSRCEDGHHFAVATANQKEKQDCSGTESGERDLQRSPRSILRVLSGLTKGRAYWDNQEENGKTWSASNAFRTLSGSLKFSLRTSRRERVRHEELMKEFERGRLELEKDTKALTDAILEKQAEIERMAVELRMKVERSGTFDMSSAEFGEEEAGEAIRSLKFCSEDAEFENVAVRKNETLFEWDNPVKG